MLRTAQYKLTRFKDGGGELYDLRRDADELHDLLDNPGMRTVRVDLERQRRYPHRIWCQGIFRCP